MFKLFPKDRTKILFGDLDFSKFTLKKRKDDSIVLCQIINNELVLFDEYTYELIIDYLCRSHFIERDLQIPANDSTKMILIEDAKEELDRNRSKEYHSKLKNLISAMVNSEGFKYNHSQVWDMKINAFMDSIKRISKIKNSDLLLQSGYSGYGVNLKEVDKNQLDWIGELD